MKRTKDKYTNGAVYVGWSGLGHAQSSGYPKSALTGEKNAPREVG